MKITIRQLNSTLSGLQREKLLPTVQEAIKELIQTMLTEKKDFIEMEETDEACIAVMRLSYLNDIVIKNQKRFVNRKLETENEM